MTPICKRDLEAFKGTSLAAYHTRNLKRWQKAGASIKRASTLFSLLGILSLASITLQAHFA
jgi:hypothetical protein